MVAGKGNNGGDGMVAARRLKDSGAKVRAVLLARIAELKGDAARAKKVYEGITPLTAEDIAGILPRRFRPIRLAPGVSGPCDAVFPDAG